MTKTISQTSTSGQRAAKTYVRPILVMGPVLSAVTAGKAVSGSIRSDTD